ncbi:MAG: type II secretion system protein [Clostridia bacterium]|nr:type II secretion system protein [Clostridia bacterium]
MKNTKRSAFTIVELVIVIAVIAILSAVLIPTFGAIIKDANIAADQTAASTLTTELHVYLMGKEIKTEAELVKALNDEKLGFTDKKLTPKSASYGYHYWYDAETQTIITGTAAQIEEIGKERKQSGTVTQDGPALMSAVLVNETENNNSANISFRDIYGYGIYLIDKGGSYIAEAINEIDKLSGKTSYESLINKLATAVSEDADKEFVTLIQTTVTTTTIRTEAGAFFTEGESTNEYFSASATFVGNVYYNYTEGSVNTDSSSAPTPTGTVEVPSHINGIVEGGLNYSAEAEVTITIESTSVLAPNSTNATVKYDDEEWTVEGDVLVSTKTENKPADIPLVKKLTFNDFVISYNDPGDASKVNVNAGNIYISYTAELDFFAKNAAEGSTETSEFINEWKSSNENVAKVSDIGLVTITTPNDTNGYSTTITAKALDMDGNEIERSVTVIVNKPMEANITLAGRTFALNGGTHELDWFYSTGAKLTSAVSGTINYKYEDVFAKGTNDITVSVAEGSIFAASGKDITLVSSESVGYFTVSVDGGLLATTFKVNVIDNSKSTVDIDFYDKDATPETYLHYIGSKDGVKLGDLFTDKGGMVGATVNIYDAVDADGSVFKWNTNWTNDEVSAQIDGAAYNGSTYTWTLDSDWENAILRFSTSDGYVPEDFDIHIKVAPSNGAAYVVKVVVVDAANVNNVEDMKTAFAAGKDVVLHSDVSVSTGTTINVGDNILYGNGYVISAKTYVADATGGTDNYVTYSYTTKKVCDNSSCGKYGTGWSTLGCGLGGHASKNIITGTTKNKGDAYTAYRTNQSMITLSGGKIDNIYIDGPVYPELQYYTDESYDGNSTGHTAYYVSGITTTGTSTIVNSYVTGFRQPVQAAGTLLNVENTTLRGGNYSNLLLSAGNLYLKNVTTVQDQKGQQATVGDTSKSVIGMGIAIGTGALSSTITIDGYLNQHNWVKQNPGGSLPVITDTSGTELNLGNLFGYIFTGMTKLGQTIEVGSLQYYIHKDQQNMESDASKCENNYVNAGIVFCEIGNSSYIDGLNVNVSIINGANRDKGIMSKTNLDVLDMRFKDLGLTLGPISINAATELGTDGRFIVWSYKDGRNWVRNGLAIDLVSGSAPSVVVDSTLTEDPSASVSGFTGTYVPVVYRGRYDNLGVYTSKYIINDSNKLTAN